MAKAHNFQQSIIDGLTEPVMVIGLDYQLLLMNKAAQRFASFDTKLKHQKYCYQISHHRDTPCSGKEHPCPLQEMRNTGTPATVLHQHSSASGEERTVEVTASPLIGTNGELEGIIELMRDVTEQKKSEQALEDYANRLRALSSQLAEVEDAERQHLAQELHDQVGQNLTALGINLNIIKSQISVDTKEDLSSRLDDSLQLVEQTTERIRDVMSELRPPVLDDYGLAAALRWYGQRFAWRTEIKVSVTGEDPEPRFPKRVEMALFRIAQEALTNVAKHSHATKVIVSLEAVKSTLRLSISDNGTGFDAGNLESFEKRGWGLLTIHQRAEAIGGQVRIDSNLGRGTEIIIEVLR